MDGDAWLQISFSNLSSPGGSKIVARLWVRTQFLIISSSLQTRPCISGPLSHASRQYILCPHLFSFDEMLLAQSRDE